MRRLSFPAPIPVPVSDQSVMPPHTAVPSTRIPARSLESRRRHGIFGIGIAALHAVQRSHDRRDRQAMHDDGYQHDQTDDRPKTCRVLQIIDVVQAIGRSLYRPDAPYTKERDRQSFVPYGRDARHSALF